ncbi:MAG: monofunctional biosynthetic peptidoglycan [Rhodospirillaceae bacterium]|nr:MAG: monofunctional biosynthetic peptidoglycan [Rhodospirillaceae bacterium]TNC98722.1 MAG: monofunctional biosynthetic peptidoglycan transglycosylase [Stygiobacter sp.]
MGMVVGLPLAFTLLYRFIPPPATPLMVIRAAQGHSLDKDWVPLEYILPHLRRAVIASEDAKFCTHWGFDWHAIDNAIERYDSGGKVLGASTIWMQAAKNVFLWPGRTFLRKGLEAYLTLFLEALWPKERILEVYLNVAEFGPGLYGAEAAARRHFGKSATALTQREAALLAAVLPDPLDRSPSRPSTYVTRRAALIDARADQIRLGRDGAC